MELLLGIFFMIVILRELFRFLFKEYPKISRQQKEERLIRRYGKERYMEMKAQAEQEAREKFLVSQARMNKADSFIKRAVFGQKDDSDSWK